MLLRLVGAAGAFGLAGCQQLGQTDPASGSPGDASGVDIQRELEIAVSVSGGEVGQRLRVTGTIASPDGIDTIAVSTEEDSVRIDLDGRVRHTIDTRLTVNGGREYAVDVEVVEPGGTSFGDIVRTGYVPIFVDDVPEPTRLVGAHYYPWYEMQPGHQDWTDRTIEHPVLGEYAADDHETIDQHLAWCLEHGIRWLSMSWWGPGSGPDRALKDAILAVDRFDDLAFSILYETLGRLGPFAFDLDDPAARDRLAADLSYLDRTYFGRANYLHLDDRPVVFVYVADRLRGDLPAALTAIEAETGVEPYLLADIPFGSAPGSFPITHVADAVTSYVPYAAREDIEAVFHDRYTAGARSLHLGADFADVGYVPVVLPGYNDTAIPDSQRPDSPVLASSPDRYRRVLDQVTPHLADAEAVLVTSFNEWYEDTQVEPSRTHGTTYLELTRDRLATAAGADYDPDGVTLRLAFNRTVVPADTTPDNPDRRPLSFMAFGIRLLDGGEELVAYDIGDLSNEPIYLEGAFGAETGGDATWRWFGGYTATTTVFLVGKLEAAGRAVLTGQPIRSNEIEATVTRDGVEVDHVRFGERAGISDYELDLR